MRLVVPLGPLEIDAVNSPGIAQHGIRPEHQPIDDAEHRGVGADAQRQRRDHPERKSWRATDTPERITNVLLQWSSQGMDQRSRASSMASVVLPSRRWGNRVCGVCQSRSQRGDDET